MNPDIEINDDETLDGRRGLRLIQKKSGYRYTEDPFWLADFAEVKKSSRVIDLGTGCGVIALLLAARVQAEIVGLEVQSELAEIAKRNVKINGFGEMVKIVEGDLRLVKSLFQPNSFDVAVTNPPYVEAARGYIKSRSERTLARHEILCGMNDALEAMRYLLKSRGRGACIYPASRLSELIIRGGAKRLEPARARFIHPSEHARAELVMVEFVKEGRGKIEILPPIFSDNL